MKTENNELTFELEGVDSINDPIFKFITKTNQEGLVVLKLSDLIDEYGFDEEYWDRYFRHVRFISLKIETKTEDFFDFSFLAERVKKNNEYYELQFNLRAIKKIFKIELIERFALDNNAE